MGLNERIRYAAMKARHEKKLRPWHHKWWGVAIIIIATLILIIVAAVGIYIINEYTRIQRGNPAKFMEEQRESYLAAVNRYSPNTHGPKNAPVTIIEFSDFSCPFCQSSYAGLKAIREKYPEQVHIVYRDFPLHNNSIFLAISARCAGEQGKFWEMHDTFFENQEKFNSDLEEVKAVMPSVAAALELDVASFNYCLTSQKQFAQIEQDFNDANYLKIEGTPTWFINNTTRITGSISSEKMEELVSGLLNIKK